jgi:membrane protein implicated in regulation of membrane protease activity
MDTIFKNPEFFGGLLAAHGIPVYLQPLNCDVMNFDFSAWWDSLATVQQIYWGIAIPSSVIFLLQIAMTFIGADHADSPVDFDVETDHGAGFQFFTFKNFIAFFTIFSWTGIACLDNGMSLAMTLPISAVAGILMMVLMASIFYFFSRLTDDGTLHIKNAIGKLGEVYLPVEAKRGNIGKINVKVQGSLRELDAVTDDETDLTTGTVIEVKGILGENVLLVSKSHS